MKIEIRYFSRGGNTKKLAEAISKAINIPAKTTDEPLSEDIDVLFLGSSVYAYGVDDNVKEFIKEYEENKQKAYSNISLRSFLTVTALLLVVLFFCQLLATEKGVRCMMYV